MLRGFFKKTVLVINVLIFVLVLEKSDFKVERLLFLKIFILSIKGEILNLDCLEYEVSRTIFFCPRLTWNKFRTPKKMITKKKFIIPGRNSGI
jgi:hypothetical protein